MKNNIKPFTLEWTIDRTFKRMIDCIVFSMDRAASRISEFAKDRGKSEEILRTIGTLGKMKTSIEQMRKNLLGEANVD